MKLEDCKVGMKVRVIGKTAGDPTTSVDGDLFPAHKRGWGYINQVYRDRIKHVFLSKTLNGAQECGAYHALDLESYIEEGQEYCQLKDITPRAIFEAQAANLGKCFMQEFVCFITTFDLDYDETVTFSDLLWELENKPEWTIWLIEHGFIEKVVEEVTYYVGQRFLNEESGINRYLLSAVGGERIIALINLDSGNTWSGNMRVKNIDKITETEFSQLVGSWKFVEIEGK